MVMAWDRLIKKEKTSKPDKDAYIKLDMDVEIIDPNSHVARRIGQRCHIIGKCGDNYFVEGGVNILKIGSFRNLCSRLTYS